MNDQEQQFVNNFLVENQGIIYKICRAYSNSEQEFDDLTQEVAFQLWKSKDRFESKSKLSTWVYRVALNVCMSTVRSKKMKTVEISHAMPIANHDDSKQDDLEILYVALKQAT